MFHKLQTQRKTGLEAFAHQRSHICIRVQFGAFIAGGVMGFRTVNGHQTSTFAAATQKVVVINETSHATLLGFW